MDSFETFDKQYIGIVKVGTPGIRVTFQTSITPTLVLSIKKILHFGGYKPVNQGQHIVLVVCFFNFFQPKKL
jgi:hypothetical protein